MAAHKSKGKASLTARGLARVLKVSHTAVNEAIRTGRLSKSYDPETKRLDRDEALREWEANRGRAETISPEAGEEKGLNYWRADREKWMAKRAEIRVREEAKELAQLRLVRKGAYEAGRAIQASAKNIAARAGPDLLNKSNLREVVRILEEHIDHHLAELSNILREEYGGSE